MFTSEEHKWQDWKTVVSAYCSVVDLQMGVIMDAIATGASTNSVNSDPQDFVAKVAQVQASTGNVHVVLAPLADTDYLLSAMIAVAIMGCFHATPQDRLTQDESPRGIIYTDVQTWLYPPRCCISRFSRGCISCSRGRVARVAAACESHRSGPRKLLQVLLVRAQAVQVFIQSADSAEDLSSCQAGRPCYRGEGIQKAGQ